MSIGYDSSKVPARDLAGRPARAGRSRARSPSTVTRPRPAPAFSGVMMASVANGGSADDIAPGVDYFQQAEEGRQLPARRPDLRRRSSPARPRSSSTGTTSTRPRPRSSPSWKVVVPDNAVDRRLLLPGHQQGRPAPGRRPALGGVPLLRRGPEPLARPVAPARSAPTPWSRPARSTRRSTTRCPRSTGNAGDPDQRADREGGDVPLGQLGEGRRLTVALDGHATTRAGE